jgi:hypothetical protein
LGNKTIYVKDDELWDRVRERAGESGMSKVVAEALTVWLAKSDAEKAGNRQYRFQVADLEGSGAPIAFEGRKLVRTKAGAKGGEIAVFLTKGGKLVVAKGRLEVPDTAIERYAVYDEIDEVAKDKSVSRLSASERAQFVEDLRKALGRDRTVWIE